MVNFIIHADENINRLQYMLYINSYVLSLNFHSNKFHTFKTRTILFNTKHINNYLSGSC